MPKSFCVSTGHEKSDSLADLFPGGTAGANHWPIYALLRRRFRELLYPAFAAFNLPTFRVRRASGLLLTEEPAEIMGQGFFEHLAHLH